jgi:hypothetical protein
MGLILLLAAVPAHAQTVNQTKASAPLAVATVVYVSEVPYQWNGEMGNPLELWARKLSSQLALPTDSGDRVKNLLPVLTWEKLEKKAKAKRDHLFVIHGYEFVENKKSTNLEALIVPGTQDKKAAMTQFVIFRRKKSDPELAARPFNMVDLLNQEVLVDRGGCGELVYRWLDCEIIPETGDTRRENLADFRTAASAEEAILAVYFGEVAACVVSKADSEEVMRYNPRGLSSKLAQERVSPPFLSHVVAASASMEPARRADLLQKTASVHMLRGETNLILTVPKPADFKTLEDLQTTWTHYFGAEKVEKSEKTENQADTRPTAPPPAVSLGHGHERRPP